MKLPRSLDARQILPALALFLGFFLLAAPELAHAQAVTRICVPSYNSAGALSCQDVISSAPLPVSPNSYPAAATPILGNATGTTGAVVGTLAAAAAKLTYICGFSVSALGGTATVGPVVIAGPATSLTYQLASAAAGVTLEQVFQPCIPASAVNTAITTTTTADGSASAVDVNSWGYQQ